MGAPDGSQLLSAPSPPFSRGRSQSVMAMPVASAMSTTADSLGRDLPTSQSCTVQRGTPNNRPNAACDISARDSHALSAAAPWLGWGGARLVVVFVMGHEYSMAIR